MKTVRIQKRRILIQGPTAAVLEAEMPQKEVDARARTGGCRGGVEESTMTTPSSSSCPFINPSLKQHRKGFQEATKIGGDFV